MSIWVEGSIPVTGTAVAAVAVDADVTATAAVVRSAFVYIFADFRSVGIDDCDVEPRRAVAVVEA